MTWIEADYQRTFEVDAPVEEVAEFLSTPSSIRDCMVDLQRAERIDDQTYRWVLEEVGAKNITFQGDYTVKYRRDGNTVRWESIGEGTMRTEGSAQLESLGDRRTRIDYRETIASDLPVPKLARRVFKPLVARETRKGIEGYLEEVIAHLNAGPDSGDES